MKLIALLLCSLLLTVTSLTAYLYIDHKIYAGQKLLAEGQKEYAAGQKKLAAGKAKLSAGKQKLSGAKKLYSGTLGLLHITKVVPVAGPALNDVTKAVLAAV